MKFEILTAWGRFIMQPANDVGKWHGKQWRLCNELAFEFNGSLYVVPLGFVTDGASIPRIYRWRFSPLGQWVRAATIHDWIYRTPDVAISRHDADKIFFAAMKQDSVSRWTRNVMYRAVQLFGRSSYKARK